jgi:hypothetical protein
MLKLIKKRIENLELNQRNWFDCFRGGLGFPACDLVAKQTNKID